ncbi:alpha/beta fold hydrolase [Treponema zioleckii]|uniref:alpha/beta fold hydrolase n=1 Tax=Treponema zioleckii TaxID=331680 RepID=UPI00168BF8A2|nr:alpha/beta hydrolase [Treponema zioleckii]
MTFEALEKPIDFQCPVYFISGAEDWICPVELIREYINQISAPQKELTLIQGCGHSPQNACPKEFAKAIDKYFTHIQ